MISFIALEDRERLNAYALYREALYDDVDRAFGWDESDQRARFATSYPTDMLFWCTDGNARRALLALQRTEVGAHLHLLLVLPEFRGRGIGETIVRSISEQLLNPDSDLRLSCFRGNDRSVAFWLRMGATITGEDLHFLSMRIARVTA